MIALIIARIAISCYTKYHKIKYRTYDGLEENIATYIEECYGKKPLEF